jgi:DNA-binding NtrC family response regulator
MSGPAALERLIGRCAAMETLRSRLARLAPSELRIHVFGETGTGKEQVARALHELSPRHRRRFVAVNVAGFSDELFTAELFGHARGAFTGAVVARDGYVADAEGGTLFIDEVGDTSPLAQVRLLRFLQEKEYQRLGETAARRADVRVVSATNVDLVQRVRQGRFREDLFFRLKEDAVLVPPLRERNGDVIVLARHFLRLFASARGLEAPTLGSDAESLLARYRWPGNVRELESEMRRLVALAPAREIARDDLSPEIQGPLPMALGPLRAELQRHEARLLQHALARHGGVLSRAAAELGISRQALYAKLRRLGDLLGTA